MPDRLRPNFYLNEEAYKLLVGSGSWEINEIPLEVGKAIRKHFGADDSFALFASGAAAPLPTGQDIAGIDWVRAEDKRRPKETSLNVYHYVIGNSTAYGYPVFDLGPSGSIAPHWSELEDLMAYFKNWK